MKIAIVGLIGSENLGEKFIARSLKWIIEQKIHEINSAEDVIFLDVDLEGKSTSIIPAKGFISNRIQNYEYYSYIGLLGELIYVSLKRIVHKVKVRLVRETVSRIRRIIWNNSLNLKKRIVKYYKSKTKDADIIVIDGAGLLEYSKNEYHEFLYSLCEYADSQGIPVVFNAIGRSGEFDENDLRCKVLMEAFRFNCVKFVSARDSIEDVQKCVPNRIQVKLRADAAFCFDKAYQLEKEKDCKVIGIGLIRGNSMQAYGSDFREDDWVDLFVEVAKELDRRNEQYQFFTNGYPADYALGMKVIEKLGKTKDCLVDRPVDDEVLAKTISSYKGLITCRMHSSIAAFALGIPSVVLSWNDKVDKYMDIIGYPERAIRIEDFKPDIIVNRFTQACDKGISLAARDKMKKAAEASVVDFLPLFVDKEG